MAHDRERVRGDTRFENAKTIGRMVVVSMVYFFLYLSFFCFNYCSIVYVGWVCSWYLRDFTFQVWATRFQLQRRERFNRTVLPSAHHLSNSCSMTVTNYRSWWQRAKSISIGAAASASGWLLSAQCSKFRPCGHNCPSCRSKLSDTDHLLRGP